MGILTQTHNGLNFLGTETYIQADSSTVMTILSGGNIGIGTTSPSEKLEVNGTIASIAASDPTIKVQGSDVNYQGRMRWNTAGNYLEFLTRYAGTYYTNTLVLDRGNVGIGTTSIDERLHVQGNMKLEQSSGDIDFRYTSNGTNKYNAFYQASTDSYGVYYNPASAYRFFISGSGDVGIGTNTPAQKLEVNGGSSYPDIRISATGLTSRYMELGMDSAVQHSIGAFGTGTYLTFKTVGTDRMVIDATGNVGIGTTSPQAKLDVNAASSSPIMRVAGGGDQAGGGKGNIRSSDQGGANFWDLGRDNLTTGNFVITPNTGNTALSITIGGNVGIGTTSPIYKFQVSGTGYFNSDLSINGDINLVANNSYININRSANTGDGVLVFKTASSNKWLLGAWGNTNENFYLYSYGVGGAVAVVDYATGNVGIGTTSPQAKLDVSGAGAGDGEIRISAGANSALFGIYRITGDASTYEKYLIGYNSAHASQPNELSLKNTGGDITLYTGTGGGGAERMRINTAGNVGIGTTSPSYKLTVRGSGAIAALQTTAATGQNWLDFQDSAGASKGYVGYGASGTNDLYLTQLSASSNIALYNGGSVRLVVNSLGNVGIGTTSPDSKLNIISGAKGIHIDKGSYSSTAANLSECRTIYAFAYDTLRNGSTTGFFITNVSTNVPAMQAVDSSNNAQNISIQPFGGNVGIGASSPSNALDILGKIKIDVDGTYGGGYGTIGFGGTTNGYNRVFGNNGTSDGLFLASATGLGIYFRANGGSIDHMIVAPSGNVGIGTTSPADPLHILTSGNDKFIRIENSNAYTGLWLNDSGTNNGWLVLSGYTNATSPGDFAIREYGVQTSLTIKQSSGNVGIGTTSPARILTVSAPSGDTLSRINAVTGGYSGIELTENNSTTSGQYWQINKVPTSHRLQFWNGSERLTILSSGNVGIGTVSPSAKLHVSGGGFDVYTDYSATNAAIGISSLKKTDGFNALVVGRFHSQNNSAALRFNYVGSNNASNYLGLGFYANDDLLVVKPSGNVGIGTTSPGAKLDVYNGNSRFWHGGTSYYTQFDTNNEINTYTSAGVISTMYLNYKVGGDVNIARGAIVAKSAGNVGIGTSSPTYKLDLVGKMQIEGDTTTDGTMRIKSPKGIVQSHIHYGTTGDWYIRSADAAGKVVIQDSGGDVGIGTNAPTTKLDVNGTVNASDFSVAGSAGYTGVVTFPSNPPGMQNLEFIGGILVNVS